jgi:hypothetical protein
MAEESVFNISSPVTLVLTVLKTEHSDDVTLCNDLGKDKPSSDLM